MRATRLSAQSAWPLPVLILVMLLQSLAATPARGATEVLYVQQTGHYMRGVFRDFWDRNGGLPNFGHPITEEYFEPGTGRVLQYFERARFERAGTGATMVQLGALGREILGERTFAPARAIQSSATRRYFAGIHLPRPAARRFDDAGPRRDHLPRGVRGAAVGDDDLPRPFLALH